MTMEGKYLAKGGFYIKAEELVKAVERFKNVIPKKAKNGIFERLLIHQMKHRLELHGSDGEIYATTFLNVEPIEGTKVDVSVTVSYKEISAYLKRIPKETTIKCVYADDEKEIPLMLIESKYGQKAFHGIDSCNYPKAAKFRCSNIAVMKVCDFRSMLARTLFATDDKADSKMNGIYFHCLPDRTRFVATNKYILSMYEKTGVVFTKPESVVVPSKVLRTFMAATEDILEDENVLIYISEGHILLSCKGFALFSKCLGTDFPDYESVIRKESRYIAILERENLIKVIKQLLPFADKKTPRIDLNFDKDGVLLSIESTSHKPIKTENLLCKYSGDTPKYFMVSFNAKLLLPILENIESEHIVMKMVSSGRPVVIQPEPQDAEAYMLCLIAPMLVFK